MGTKINSVARQVDRGDQTTSDEIRTVTDDSKISNDK